MSRPPKFVHSFLDRHGRPRHYFRRAGFPQAPLPGLPWSPEFMAAYEMALAGQSPQAGKGRAIPGSMSALVASYEASPAFRNMAPSTQSVYHAINKRFCEEVENGKKNGDKRAALLEHHHVLKLMRARAERPDSANGLRKVLRALMKHAVEIGLRKNDPTRDVKPIPAKSKKGFHSWTDEEIEQFQRRHPIGTRARLAFELLLSTGQRRSDVVRMGPQHLRGDFLHVCQDKTGVELDIPVHPDLAAILASEPTQHLAFLTTEFGKVFTPAGFGNWFRDRCNEAGLRHCSAHGLRKAAARLIAEAGCTVHEIKSITGHASLRDVQRYTAAVSQRSLAADAMEKIIARTTSGKPSPRFAEKAKKS
jgi:integrase